MTKGLEFDPGFAPYVLAFQGTVEYLYLDINRFKNLSQKKIKFRQYYKKILEIYKNNLGFYIGCLLWALYLKSQDTQKIINNPCFGQKYDEENNTSEVDFLLKFIELFPKDMKYFLNEQFEFDKNEIFIIEQYKNFLAENKGFVETKTNDDIKIPSDIKKDADKSFKNIIDEAIKQENLSLLVNSIQLLV